MDATTVAVDVAKTVFELAIANGQWRLVARQRLNRAQFTRFLAETAATHVVMEACGMAHYWGRLAQQHGHRVTLVPPAYVRPYVRRNKTDRADAEAILEAVRSGEMPSVPVKRIEQQALVALHRVREQWKTTRTARINTLRGILREHGILLPAGACAALQAVPTILEDAEIALPMHLIWATSSLSTPAAPSSDELKALINVIERPTTIALQRRRVGECNHNRIMEIHERETLPVPIAVLAFAGYFGTIRGQVAVDTPGDRVMRAARLHDAYRFMTSCTRADRC
jgi:hypothetical protein